MQPRRFPSLTLVVLTLALLSAGTSPVGAQEEAEGTLSRIYMFTPKAGMQMEFEAGLQAHVEDLRAAGHPWEWWVFQVETGESSGQYGAISGGHTWADFEDYDANHREAVLASYAEHMAPHVAGYTSVITQGLPEISRPPTGPFGFVQVIHFNLKSGREEHFMATIQGFHEAFKQGDQAYSWSMPFSGASGPQMTLALFYEGWTSMPSEEGDMRAAAAAVWGDAGATLLMDTMGESTWGTESWLARMRPDLSYMPDMTGGEM